MDEFAPVFKYFQLLPLILLVFMKMSIFFTFYNSIAKGITGRCIGFISIHVCYTLYLLLNFAAMFRRGLEYFAPQKVTM